MQAIACTRFSTSPIVPPMHPRRPSATLPACSRPPSVAGLHSQQALSPACATAGRSPAKPSAEHAVRAEHAERAVGAVQVRLLTDLFSVLIPGIQSDYPHRSIALTIAATAEPTVVFLPGKGARFEGTYETHVYVLPPSGGTHGTRASGGGVPDNAVDVAVLEAEVSGVAALEFKRSKVSDLQVRQPRACVPFTA